MSTMNHLPFSFVFSALLYGCLATRFSIHLCKNISCYIGSMSYIFIFVIVSHSLYYQFFHCRRGVHGFFQSAKKHALLPWFVLLFDWRFMRVQGFFSVSVKTYVVFPWFLLIDKRIVRHHVKTSWTFHTAL